MIRVGRRRGGWLIAIAVLVVTAALRALGLLQPLDHAFADQRARWLTREVRSDIVIVGIDAASLDAVGTWPWPRRQYARLIDQLAGSGPSSVFLDVELGSLSQPPDDALLESALAKPRDYPIFLPVYFRELTGTNPALAVTYPRMRFARSTERAVVNPQPASDGRVRSWRTSWLIGGERLPSIVDRGRRLPDEHDVPIDYSIALDSFVFVSCIDVLEGRVPREVFAGKHVFVGATAPLAAGRWSVPVHRSLPSVVVQALATESVNQGAPRTLSAWANAAWLALWISAAAWFMGARASSRLLVLGGSLASILGLSVLAFHAGFWLEVAAPAVAVVLLFVAGAVRSLDAKRWRAVRQAFGVRRGSALLENIVQSSTDCIVCVDGAGIVRTANPAALQLFGCGSHELLGQPIAKFVTALAGEGPGARLDALHGTVRECDARSARGEVFPVEIGVSRVRASSPLAGLAADQPLYTAIVRDIRERRAQQSRLQHQATHDALTGLANRAALMAYLETALGAGSASGGFAVLMLDLCRFKQVNDTLGHSVGDRVLCDVARRFAASMAGPETSGGGFIARIGGDEFTVVIERPESGECIAQFSQRLADCLRQPIDVAGISIEVGVSIGIARFPQDAADAQALLRNADVAMYAAKRRGVPYEYYSAACDENTVRKLAIGGELRSAIEGRQLELHYQPQVNLRSGLVESCEALVRWIHPTQGNISPAEFIAIAESTDLIRPLTEWTLTSALAQARQWRDRGVHLRVAVNLSARLLQDTAFPARLGTLLRDSGAAASSLELEITENSMMVDPDRALRVIQEIDRIGVSISIDDFGTGYSSLGYLRNLPVKALKLDKSFVMGMRHQGDDRLIVESTARMAHALKLELVAEGVESEWDASFLRASGYDFAQGFRYSRALPADQFLGWVVAYNATAMLTAGDAAPMPEPALAVEEFYFKRGTHA